MSRGLRLSVLGAGCPEHHQAAAGIPSGIAMVARVVAMRDYRALGVANEVSLETFCGEVKRHG